MVLWKKRGYTRYESWKAERPMEHINQVQQPTNVQGEIRELNLSQETRFQVHKSLCELQCSLINHLSLTCQGRTQIESAIQEQENERYRVFNWECPGRAEYETVSGIMKQQKQLLQQEYNERRDTSQRKLLLELLPSLWRYLLFKSTSEENEQLNSASSFHQREWREFQQENDNLDRGITFKQNLRMLISYLTELTTGWRMEDSQTTRHIEEINSGEINPEL